MVSHLLWALGKMSRWTSKLLDAQNGQPLQDLVFRQAEKRLCSSSASAALRL